jgi:hypothetical protein
MSSHEDDPGRSPTLDDIPIWDLLDRLGIGVFSVDHTTGRFAVVNDAVARMTGFESAAHMTGAPVVDHYKDPGERAEGWSRTSVSARPPRRASGRAASASGCCSRRPSSPSHSPAQKTS